MISGILEYFRKNRKGLYIFLSLLLLGGYIYVFSYSKGLFGFLLACCALAFLALRREKARANSKNDSFEDDNLFFRHGSLYRYSRFPIRFRKTIDHQTRQDTMQTMGESLVESMREEIDSEIPFGTHKTEIIEIHDKGMRSDRRKFIRFQFQGQRGAEANHFILFQYVGNYIIINLSSYLRGIAHWYDYALFYLSSPLNIWFWIWPWLRGQHSILSSLSKNLDNSFETFDMLSYMRASRYTILEAIKEYLRNNNLLSEELEQMINVQMIYNVGHQVNISGTGNTVGSVSQSAPIPN